MKTKLIAIVIGAFATVTKWLVQKSGGLGNKRTSGDNLNYRIAEISENTEKSPRDLLSLRLQLKTTS